MSFIIHPTTMAIDGIIFQVAARVRLTDQQAAKIAMRYWRTHKFTKKHKGQLVQVVTSFDEETIGLL